MNILITGGAGFIGSHICRLLLDKGHQITIYDNFSTSSPSKVDKRAKIIDGDIRDLNFLAKSLNKMEAVIHLASLALVEESVNEPVKYIDNNVLGTASLLEAMRIAEVKKIIFSSSTTVYGDAKVFPITEETPFSATNPYGASKIAVEALLESFHNTDQFDVVILRYFNPYGPGEDHNPESHAVPNFIKAALAKKPIPLYSKGEHVRDFIYVEDLAKAHIEVLDMKGFNIFNVGVGQGVKIKDLIMTIEDIMGSRLEIQHLGDRPGDAKTAYASNEKILKLTDWKPETPLKEGLEKTIAYFQKLN